MSRMIQCVKLGKQLAGLETVPFKDELGKRIYEEVSAEAWQMWIQQATMLINEYRLNPSQAEAQAFLRKQMTAFFFGEGSESQDEPAAS